MNKFLQLAFVVVLLAPAGMGAKRDGWKAASHTQLMRAAEAGQLDAVKDLVSKGENVNARNWARETALMFAARNGHLDVVKYLVEVGKADMGVVSQFGRTALAEAQKYNDIVAYLKQQGAK